MKTIVTAENYEEIVNKLTVDFIFKNGRLRERLENRKWMTKTEHLNYFADFDMDSMESLQPYMDKNNINRFEKGTTYMNFFDQYLIYMELLSLLSNRGKKLDVK